MMRAALEALHLRKASQATPKSTQTTPKTSQPTSKLSQSTVKSNHQLQKSSHMTSKSNPSTSSYSGDPNKTPGPLPQFQPPPEVTKSGELKKSYNAILELQAYIYLSYHFCTL